MLSEVHSSNVSAQSPPCRMNASPRCELQLAGKPYNWGPTEFFGLRIFVAGALGVLIFLVMVISQDFVIALLAAVVAAFVGFVIPTFWLRSKIRRRQSEITKTLPDALDLITITVEAGMGFDGAMQKVAEKWNNEISRGFSKVIALLQRSENWLAIIKLKTCPSNIRRSRRI